MEKSPVRWSDLPPQLWQLIGKRLDTYIDVLRFRSVCRSWRASLPQSNSISLPSPIAVPYPVVKSLHHPFQDVLVLPRIIYGVSPLHHHQTSNSASSSSSSSSRSSEGWLVIIESTNHGKMRFLRPLCTHFAESKDRVFKKEVNLLDFRIHEVAKSYTLINTNFISDVIKKVVIFPNSAWIDVKNCTIIVVLDDGKLGFTKHGDGKWTLIGDANFQFDDVIVYKSQIYTINREGRVFLIDSWMKLVQISPPLGIFSKQKHLVECGGELYVVDRFMEKLLNFIDEFSWFMDYEPTEVADFKIHRLDQEGGKSKWEEVKDLGNEAFVLGVDCFSVSATDFEGFEGNCIYFSHVLSSNYAFCTHVFDLQKGTIVDVSMQIFRPPRIWLDSEAYKRLGVS